MTADLHRRINERAGIVYPLPPLPHRHECVNAPDAEWASRFGADLAHSHGVERTEHRHPSGVFSVVLDGWPETWPNVIEYGPAIYDERGDA